MTRKIFVGGAAAIALVAVGAAVSAVQADHAHAQGYGGYGCPGMMGMMGPGMMGGMMGPGMMGPGMMGNGMMGPGMMMGQGWGGQQANLNLSAKDVTAYLERWVTMSGNPRLKVGPVAERDAHTITADIVTTDRGALVQRFEIDRNTGVYRSIQ